MDNLTHSLVGLALSRAGLSRYSPYAAGLLILSANAPDVDIVALAGGPLQYFENHRGYTHSLAGAPVLAALSVAAIALIAHKRLPWRRAFALCIAGVLSHLLLDWTNNYGIRLLLPFSSKWFYLDWNYLYDVVLDLVLVFAAVWPWFSRLVGSEIGDKRVLGRGIARFALSFFVLYDGARALLHERAVAHFESRLYDDAVPLTVAAMPDALNPLSWTGIIETAGAHYLYPARSGDNAAPLTFYKIPQSEEILNARKEEPFRFFTYFARFPVWTEDSIQKGERREKQIELTDLRFGRPGSGSFHALAEADASGRILRAWYSFAPPKD